MFKALDLAIQSTFNAYKHQLLNFKELHLINIVSCPNGIFHNYMFWIINCSKHYVITYSEYQQ